jgi:hypothetical protein
MTAMGPVDRFQVLPLHHQVGICDVDAVDVPEWETGEEPLVAAEQCILVATRGDLDPVELEVWTGPPATPPPGPMLFDGELCTTGKGVEVGDQPGNDPAALRARSGAGPIPGSATGQPPTAGLARGQPQGKQHCR